MLKNYSIKNNFLRGLLLSSITLGLFSCTDDNDFHKDFDYIPIPITSVDAQDTVYLKEQTAITAHSNIKQGCQTYFTMDYVTFGSQIIATAKAIEHKDQDCGLETELTLDINFTPTELDSYTFMFWTGQDPITKEDKYITKKIVIESKEETLNSN